MRRFLTGAAVGVGAAVVGLLPWLLTGAVLPLQDLDTATTVDRQPLALLPFSQYAVVEVAALLVTGALVAGLLGRALPVLRRPSSRAGLAVGVVLVQAGAIVQTALVVQPRLQVRVESFAYLALLVLGAVAALCAGIVILVLVAVVPRGGALLGIGLAAVLVGSWVDALVPPLPGLLAVTRWVPAAVLGAGIAWSGLRTVGRVVAAVLGLVVLWLGQALVTAVVNSLGSRVLLRFPLELLDQARGVFVMAATLPEVALPPVLVAVGVAAAGLLLGLVVRRRATSPAG